MIRQGVSYQIFSNQNIYKVISEKEQAAKDYLFLRRGDEIIILGILEEDHREKIIRSMRSRIRLKSVDKIENRKKEK
ncbi:hypothetical protein lbkm_3979 [Lachnospiraceae bacterium KM106-2]|nr:hypothetical protein lbkm_3979 [Lachnospiraceae bacterium KM106-2]